MTASLKRRNKNSSTRAKNSIAFYALNGGGISKIDLIEQTDFKFDVSYFQMGLYL